MRSVVACILLRLYWLWVPLLFEVLVQRDPIVIQSSYRLCGFFRQALHLHIAWATMGVEWVGVAFCEIFARV